MKRLKKIVSMILIGLLIGSNANIISVKAATTVEALPDLKLSTASNPDIQNGAKGINFGVSSITLSFNSAFIPDTSKLKVYAYANGKIDETDLFDPIPQSGKVIFTLKNGATQLRKHTLYEIYAPQGAFVNKADPANQIVNSEIRHMFVTRTDYTQIYDSDILVKTTPSHGTSVVDDYSTSIEFQFADDIAVDTEVLNNIDNYIQVSTENLKTSGIIENHSIKNDYQTIIEGSKLVLKPKEGKLKDLCHYTVRLRDEAVYLKNSSQKKVYNLAEENIVTDDEGDHWEAFSFQTNDMLMTDKTKTRTSPNDNATGIETQPDIDFHFKYPIDKSDIDTGKIHITSASGDEDFTDDFNIANAILVYSDTNMTDNVLRIRINDQNGGVLERLRKNTMYKVTVEAGAITFRVGGNTLHALPRTLMLYFTTGNEGNIPVITGYASDASKTDNITSSSSTSLGADGTVYIHFDRAVRWDKQSNDVSRRASIELYKLAPIANTIQTSPTTGTIAREIFEYNQVGSNINPGNERLTIDSIEIDASNPKMIKIKSNELLSNLQEYEIYVPGYLVEDMNGYNLQDDIEFGFWTKASTDSVSPRWGNTNIRPVPSANNTAAWSTQASKPLLDVQRFHSTNPIIFYIDKEVIPTYTDTDIDTDTNRFEGISLTKYYNANQKVTFQKYILEHYFDNGIKKTKLLLYPSTPLDYGEHYRMSISNKVLRTRSGKYLEAKDVFFVTEQNSAQPKGIHNISPNTFKTIDFYNQKAEFTINGYNFNEKIKTVTLETYGASTGVVPVKIHPQDITFIDTNTISVKVKGSDSGDPAKVLSREGSVGQYTVSIQFDDSSGTYEDISWGGTLKVGPRQQPNKVIKMKDPSGGDAWYNEKDLNSTIIDGVRRYFIKVVFEDTDGSLEFDKSAGLALLKEYTTVCPKGSDISSVDIDFLNQISGLSAEKQSQYIDKHIFIEDSRSKEASLYIPIILLKSDTTYEVGIAPGIVYYYGTTGSEYKNDYILWEFTTTTTPIVKEIMTATVPEDYDEDIPIIITGDLFYGNTVTVYFNDDIEADKVRLRENSQTGEKYLEVSLPDGRDRLDPGIYSITVENDKDHQRIDCGTLSVVEAGEYVPNEQYKVKSEDRKGKVRADVKVSADMLMLESKYADDRYLELDLDEMMGEEVRVRKIEYRGNKRDTIHELVTKSKWCDITVYGLTLDASKDDRNIVLELGRIEPSTAKMLMDKLKGKVVKSEFIQISGQNFKIDKVTLKIPFKGTNGQQVQVLRYDEETRNFYGESFTVDFVNKKVNVTSKQPGIFFVIE